MSARTAQADEAAAGRELSGRLARALARAPGCGSRLLPFARMADDIADASRSQGRRKAQRLDALEQALVAGDPAIPQAARLHAVDARTGRASCEARDSAARLPAGRGEGPLRRLGGADRLLPPLGQSGRPFSPGTPQGARCAAQAPADALCTALQILNHLQDCGRDRGAPRPHLHSAAAGSMGAGSERAFFDPAHAALRRSVLDAVLDRVDALIDQAQSLPEHLQNRRLRAQSVATIALARASERAPAPARIRSSTRVQVSKADAGMAFLRGLGGTLRTPVSSDSHVTAAMVRRSGSSFRLGMQSLQPRAPARHACGLCLLPRGRRHRRRRAPRPPRSVAFLGEWRREIDRLHRAPETPIGRELARASTPVRAAASRSATRSSTAWRRTARSGCGSRRSRSRPLRPARGGFGRCPVDPHLRRTRGP